MSEEYDQPSQYSKGSHGQAVSTTGKVGGSRELYHSLENADLCGVFLLEVQCTYHMREKFLKLYANIPLNLRREIVLDMSESYGPITWEVAYREINANTAISKNILERLTKLKFIPA